MAHHVEPMDIDSDFDNKENSLHHNNVLPFTEKGYEELDVSELNMKLRYSVTPASSPMSKSYTANCLDNRSLDSVDDSLNVTVNENVNLTRSLNSTITKNDNVVKSLKTLPLQTLPTEQYVDNSRTTSVLRPLEPADADNGNITVTVSAPSDIDENLSLPSTSSSALQTPEATTPTKDIPPKDGGSPIMRGLKSVLNMFRSSQSPIPPADENTMNPEILSPAEDTVSTPQAKTQVVSASTPISTHRKKEMSPTKRSSPQKDSSIVFNEDLEKELQWKDETTIIFSQEKIPIHKLLFQQPINDKNLNKNVTELVKEDNLNATVEYMDISYNDSIRDRTVTDIENIKKGDGTFAGESDSEFVDCETTFSKNESQVIECDDKPSLVDQTQDLNITKEIKSNNESGSRLKQIILDTTQDILDATLSVRPEDLLPESSSQINVNFNDTIQNGNFTMPTEIQAECQTQDKPILFDQTVDVSNPLALESDKDNQNATKIMENNPPMFDQTVDISNPSTLEKCEDLNATKVMENKQILDQTVDISNPSALEKVEDLHSTVNMETKPTLDQTVDISNPLVLETNQEDPNATKTLDTTLTKQNDQTFDIKLLTSTQEENLNATKTIESVFSQTQAIECPQIENLNVTVTNETVTIDKNDQTFEVPPTPVDNIKANTTITNENINASLSEPAININEKIPVVPTPGSEEPAIDQPLPTLDNITSSVKEASMTELPVDIPLPDEDDFDKELNLPTDIDLATPPVSLPLDFVNDMKITHDNVKAEEKVTEDCNSNDKIDLPKECAPIDSALLEGDDINNRTIDVVTEKETCDKLEQIKLEVEVPSPCGSCVEAEKVDLLPEVALSSNDIKENEKEVNTVIDNNDINVKNVDEDKELNRTVENVETQEILNQSVVPMDINESVCELKPLPDIINQTIAMSNTESILTVDAPKPDVPEQLESKSENTHNAISEPVITEAVSKSINEVEPHNTENIASSMCGVFVNEKLPKEIISTQINESNADVTMTDVSELPVTTNIDAIPVENTLSTVEQVPVEIIEKEKEVEDAKPVEEEIVASKSNSPFVSVVADSIPEMKAENNTEIEIGEDPFPTRTKVVITPPSSPPIRSKGYNFNFDDLDFDPFATKTKIRESPTLESPNKVENEPKPLSRTAEKPVAKKDFNRRKSQPERKRPTAPKRKFNSTFDGTTNNAGIVKPVEKLETSPVGDIQLDAPVAAALKPDNVTIEENKLDETVNVTSEITNVPSEELETKSEIVQDIAVVHPTESSTEIESHYIEPKATSSSEQSTYFSAGTSSSESSIPSRNVFNLPEIDDKNFNPFATKSKMRQSPPPSLDSENPFVTKSKVANSPDSSIIIPQKDVEKTNSSDDKIETELMEKEVIGNLSNATVSSAATDEKNRTTKEINTEDEDTIEGPFLEAEDLNQDDKMSDFDGENIDMMQFTEIPPQTNEDNLDNGEMFIDAEAFEFLLNQNKSNTVVDSGKESLFLKFDPLFAKRMSAVTSDGVVASLARLQKGQSTPTKAARSSRKTMPSPVAGPSTCTPHGTDMNISEELNDDLNVTVSKPMMVVPPAVNPVTPRNKSLTPNRSNRRSFTFTSPAMAVIDRLLSLSGNNSPAHDNTVPQVSREQNEANIALSQLRELLAEKEITVHNLRTESNELSLRLNTLESQVKALETEGQDRLQKINNLNETLAEKTKINKSMAAVVEEYERTIASLIAEIAQDKKKHAEERMQLINERDEQTAHLASMEVSFSDLHSKYEKSKQIILNCKANEEAYKKSIKEFEENLTKMQNNYELLKQHATSKLNHANQELEKMNRSHEAEVLKLNAMIKRKELHITSLEESYAQKIKANEELTAICDELINKVG